ncbi:MAG: elongation factor G [Bacteroidetes bacterium]|nr:MAG: elongation factor G [Bacteroidota bacterium]REK00608.1 MAG: elongation factor G [Bacteroidota bacterium]REK35270.1 MAG: elongation factor G [Bacteroidota bacterium]REK48346.1 MAG: elongation factor G [Bacteroidota bacterium]
MKVYDDKHIKNVVLVGATKSGKTTLAETMLFEAGLINRRGTVEEKNTVSDYHEIEHERGSSVYATTLHTEWKDYKINIIDTPGLDDFIGEVISSLRVADTAVMLLNAENGVEVGTELIWKYVEQFQKPIIFAVNHLDHSKSDFDNTVDMARKRFGKAITLMQYPVAQGEGFNAIIDLLKMVMYKFPATGGKPEKLPIPDDEKEKADKLHNELVEKAAENDEKLMELYFEKGSLDEDELRIGLKKGMLHHDVYPVFCLSAKKDMGSGRLMGFIDNVAPSATELLPESLEGGGELPCDPKGPPAIFIFKTIIEPHLGKLSFFKVMSGEITAGMDLENTSTGHVERLNQLFIMDGKNRNPINKFTAGDIGATLKLKDSQTNHTLCKEGKDITFEKIHFPEPRLRVAVVAKNKSDDEKLGTILNEIHQEDPTLMVEFSRELKQVILSSQGDLHFNVIKWKLEKIYKVEVDFIKPRIPYRETIQKTSLASYRHKKQSGGAGQFGEVYMKIEPYFEGMPEPTGHSIREKEVIELSWGGKLVFYNCIVGGVIDQRFIPSIQKGVMEKMQTGPLTGSYVRDVRVIVYDGKMHPVDSNDISFKIAGMMAFKEAFHQADPKILEPIYEVEILVPEELMGDVVTDLQTRRSIIMGMDSKGNYQVIKARTPLAELDKYSTSLRSITQGRGSYTGRFSDYAPVPSDIQRKLAEEYKDTENH